MAYTIFTFGVRSVDADLAQAGNQALNGASGPNEITDANLIGANGVPFQQLLLFMGQNNDGDLNVDDGETAYNLSDMASRDRVISLATTNYDDPIRISAHGLSAGGVWGDLSAAVRFDNERGFGLDNAPDGEAAAHWLNGGDSITFEVGAVGGAKQSLAVVSFVVKLAGAAHEHVVIDFDGDGVGANGGLEGFDLGLVSDGEAVTLDFATRTIAIGAAQRAMSDAEFAAFLAGGLDRITIGSLSASTPGFSVQALSIATAAAVNDGAVIEAPSGGGATSGTDAGDILVGSAASDALSGGAGADVIFGGEGADAIDGGGGDDLAEGGEGDDIILGGAGADVLIGGGGDDIVSGGADADRYVVRSLDDLNPNTDYFTDFEPGIDTIDLSAVGGLSFIGAGAFNGAAGQVRFELVGATTEIQIDADGDGIFDDRIIVSNGGFNFMETAPGSLLLEGSASNHAPNFTAPGDFIVNTTIAGSQFAPQMATLGDGRVLAVWVSNDEADGSRAVRGRLFGADGAASGGDFLINTTIAGAFGGFGGWGVTALGVGSFLIAWTPTDLGVGSGVRGRVVDAATGPAGAEFQVSATFNSTTSLIEMRTLADGRVAAIWTSQEGAGSNVYAKIFGEDGVAQTGDIRVNQVEIGGNSNPGPQLEALANGDIVVTWEFRVGDGAPSEIRARLLDADGVAIGGDFTVNSAAGEGLVEQQVAALAGGGFLITWTAVETGYDIRGRFFGADGVAVGDDFLVNTTTASDQEAQQVAALNDGRAVVVWIANENDFLVLRGRVFEANGAAVGDDFPINSAVDMNQYPFKIEPLAGGGFAVIWEGFDAVNNYDIQGRVFASNGAAIGDAFTINTNVSDEQVQSQIAALPDGGFMVTWYSWEGDLPNIRARKFNADGSPADNFVNVSLLENTDLAVDLAASDLDAGDALAFSIAGGADALLLAVDANTGAVSFLASPDFEAPTDADSDGVYELIVQVTDAAGANDTMALAVTVLDMPGQTLLGGATPEALTGGAEADTINGAAGADQLEGGGGADSFVFVAGQANGDVVVDFSAGDRLVFEGYGTAAGGASFVQVDATHWQVTSADGLTVEVITLASGASINAGDYLFGDG